MAIFFKDFSIFYAIYLDFCLQKCYTLRVAIRGCLVKVYLIDEFRAGSETCFVLVIDYEDGKKERDAFFSRIIAPNTFYAYERISLLPNCNMNEFLKYSKELKGVRVYASKATAKETAKVKTR